VTTSQKAALSLFVTVILFGVFTALAFTGLFETEELFSYPQTMKIIFLVAFFLTVYLTIFLFLNLRQDPVTVVQNRLKRLQISLIEQFYERKADADWARWSRELELRRDEVKMLMKRGIKTASGNTGNDAEVSPIDALIDKSWDELLTVMGTFAEAGAKAAEELDELESPEKGEESINEGPEAVSPFSTMLSGLSFPENRGKDGKKIPG
jgi:hypothetical protein